MRRKPIKKSAFTATTSTSYLPTATQTSSCQSPTKSSSLLSSNIGAAASTSIDNSSLHKNNNNNSNSTTSSPPTIMVKSAKLWDVIINPEKKSSSSTFRMKTKKVAYTPHKLRRRSSDNHKKQEIFWRVSVDVVTTDIDGGCRHAAPTSSSDIRWINHDVTSNNDSDDKDGDACRSSPTPKYLTAPYYNWWDNNDDEVDNDAMMTLLSGRTTTQRARAAAAAAAVASSPSSYPRSPRKQKINLHDDDEIFLRFLRSLTKKEVLREMIKAKLKAKEGRWRDGDEDDSSDDFDDDHDDVTSTVSSLGQNGVEEYMDKRQWQEHICCPLDDFEIVSVLDNACEVRLSNSNSNLSSRDDGSSSSSSRQSSKKQQEIRYIFFRNDREVLSFYYFIKTLKKSQKERSRRQLDETIREITFKSRPVSQHLLIDKTLSIIHNDKQMLILKEEQQQQQQQQKQGESTTETHDKQQQQQSFVHRPQSILIIPKLHCFRHLRNNTSASIDEAKANEILGSLLNTAQKVIMSNRSSTRPLNNTSQNDGGICTIINNWDDFIQNGAAAGTTTSMRTIAADNDTSSPLSSHCSRDTNKINSSVVSCGIRPTIQIMDRGVSGR